VIDFLSQAGSEEDVGSAAWAGAMKETLRNRLMMARRWFVFI
jgi:hypothetical protein